MDERQEWEAERNQVIRAQRIAREEAAELRESAARLDAAKARRDAAWDAARRTGQPVPSTGDVLARARDMLEASEDRDAYGSQDRPAIWWTAADGSPVEVSARPPVGAQRSVSDIETDELLARARQLSESRYMAVHRARLQARRAREDEASRASGYGYGPEITR